MTVSYLTAGLENIVSNRNRVPCCPQQCIMSVNICNFPCKLISAPGLEGATLIRVAHSGCIELFKFSLLSKEAHTSVNSYMPITYLRPLCLFVMINTYEPVSLQFAIIAISHETRRCGKWLCAGPCISVSSQRRIGRFRRPTPIHVWHI